MGIKWTKSFSIRYVNLNNNPFHCGCNINYLRLYFEDITYRKKTNFFLEADKLYCQSPKRWKNTKVNSISSRDNVCEYQEDLCPYLATCYQHPFHKFITVDFNGKGLLELPDLNTFQNYRKLGPDFKEIFITFQGNYITKMPKDWNGIGYGEVDELDLSNNTIEDIESIPENLKVLQLHNNNLTHLSDKTLSLFIKTSLKNLTLHNNPWTCNCSTVNFHKYIQENFDKVIIIAYLLILIRL